MARVPEVVYEKLTPEQQRVYKEVAGPRLVFGGPFTVYIRHPELADAMNKVGEALRKLGKLNKRLTELLILVVAREWNCDYQWVVHEEAAVKAGLAPEVVAAILKGKAPKLSDDEQVVYDVATEILRAKHLSQATYDRALAMLGEEVLLEVVVNCGRYSQAAIVVNCYDVPTLGDRHPLTETKVSGKR
ncbi:MAG: carboxymuconolactone decarboxylase family protein [Deltaproteobacteria bacterium]|nr:carboxymuconolactone decarboxylase family protein [Deltaproteobacteria bacterium]